jgi:hypothetical protein
MQFAENHDDFRVSEAGRVLYLNRHLVRRMGIGPEGLKALRESHAERLRLFAAMDTETDPAALLKLARLFDALEFRQQALWGFELDANFHLWWSVPGCSCPKLRNEGLVGRPYRAVNSLCPIHGQLLPAGIDIPANGIVTVDTRVPALAASILGMVPPARRAVWHGSC